MDEDTAAFDALMAAHRLPASTDAETAVRAGAIEAATRAAIEVPLGVMAAALESMEVIAAMAAEGLAPSVSDAGVACLLARAAVRGAGLNVAINAAALEDGSVRADYLERADRIAGSAAAEEERILRVVADRMPGG